MQTIRKDFHQYHEVIKISVFELSLLH